MCACLGFQRFFQIGGRLAQPCMNVDEAVCQRAQDRVSFARYCQLIAEILPQLPFCDSCHADAKSLQHTTHMTFEILAQADQPLASSHKRTNAVCLNGPDINRREPPCPRQLSEAFGIRCVRLVDPGGQAFVGPPGINADSGQVEFLKAPLQLDRQLSAFVHDDLGA
jgi:hypothetical protein